MLIPVPGVKLGVKLFWGKAAGKAAMSAMSAATSVNGLCGKRDQRENGRCQTEVPEHFTSPNRAARQN
jgi:hypothetical protein